MKFDRLVNQYLGLLSEEENQNTPPQQNINPQILNNPNFRNLWAAVTAHENAANNKQNTNATLQGIKDAYNSLPQEVKQYGDQLLSAHPDENVQTLLKQYKTPTPTQTNNQQSNQSNAGQQANPVSNSGNPVSSTPAYKTGTPVG
jgi:hypothetical protein